jgi:hypothetical protein
MDINQRPERLVAISGAKQGQDFLIGTVFHHLLGPDYIPDCCTKPTHPEKKVQHHAIGQSLTGKRKGDFLWLVNGFLL